LNGIGKSTILKYIQQCTYTVCTEIFVKGSSNTLADLNTNERGMTFSTCCLVQTLLVVDNKAVDMDEHQPPLTNVSKKSEDSENSKDNKIPINKLTNTEALLQILKNSLDDLNAFIKKKNFKYTISQEVSAVMILCNEKEDTTINISDLSPGEDLIFRLLIWQYIFALKKFRPAEKCVILFDEPDAHLHPSAVKYLVDNLKDLCSLGVQIILTTHNPTTVSFVERENVFLLEKENDKLSIRRGLTESDIYQELTSRLVSIATPSRKIFVEGDDAAFYNVVYTFLKDSNITRSHFQMNFIAMPNKSRRNKENIVKLIENFDPHLDCDYDDIHSFYGITDDDNDSLKFEATPPDTIKLKNLFAL